MYVSMQGRAISAESSNDAQSNHHLGSDAWLSLQQPNPYAYKCQRCSKSFPSSHALGGHQNAHRKERMEESKLQENTNLYILSPTISVVPPSGSHNSAHGPFYGYVPSEAAPMAVYGAPYGHGMKIYHPYLKPEMQLADEKLNQHQEMKPHAMDGHGPAGTAQVEVSSVASDGTDASTWALYLSEDNTEEVTSGGKLDLTLRL